MHAPTHADHLWELKAKLPKASQLPIPYPSYPRGYLLDFFSESRVEGRFRGTLRLLESDKNQAQVFSSSPFHGLSWD
ncbi:hypothetical protein LENED_001808 [Lentinula edodes]|uniref:Uncharacterized protein n=1 Tax=Lentinula edodes TaxID=5353 RepID=A0A1Q3DZH0_LENED|nr:hypothetical protein LENED_001808 [Lentinula edodes]